MKACASIEVCGVHIMHYIFWVCLEATHVMVLYSVIILGNFCMVILNRCQVTHLISQWIRDSKFKSSVLVPPTMLGRIYLEWTMRRRRDGKWVRQHIPKEENQYSIIPVHLFSGRDKQ